MGYANISIITGDGSLGLPETAPYDGILVTQRATRAFRAQRAVGTGRAARLPGGAKGFTKIGLS